MNIKTVIALIASIVLGVLVNWLYDLLKDKHILSSRRGVRFFLIVFVVSLPLLLFTITPPEIEPPATVQVIPEETLTITPNGDGVVVNVGGNVNNSPFVINPSGEVTIVQGQTLPTPIVEQTIAVSGLHNSHICVTVGQIVVVQASGGIVVGPWVGSVGPDGTNNGVGGLSLDGYDIIPELPHGSLLCRLDEDDDWQLCGAEKSFQVEGEGCLVFDINDNEQGNNSGAFEVEVVVFDEVQ